MCLKKSLHLATYIAKFVVGPAQCTRLLKVGKGLDSAKNEARSAQISGEPLVMFMLKPVGSTYILRTASYVTAESARAS